MSLRGERRLTVHEVGRSWKHWGYVITGSENQGGSEIDEYGLWSEKVRAVTAPPHGHPVSLPTHPRVLPSSP